MRIIKMFSNLIMIGVFLIALTAIWTDQIPKKIYVYAKSLIIYNSLLSYEQKIAVSHVIRRIEDTLAGIAEQANEYFEEEGDG